MSTVLSPAPAPATHHPARVEAAPSTLSVRQLVQALPGAVRGLDPRRLWDSPVMFVVEVGAALSTVLAVVDPSVFAIAVAGRERR